MVYVKAPEGVMVKGLPLQTVPEFTEMVVLASMFVTPSVVVSWHPAPSLTVKKYVPFAEGVALLITGF